MASTSGTKKHKDKSPQKVYVEDSDWDDEFFDFNFLDFSLKTFKPSSNLYNDPLLNLLCDENMLKWGIDMMRDDQNRHGVEEAKHRYILEVNDNEVCVEYRAHDPNQLWK